MLTNKVLAKAPGRINIIGEHVDYNDGFVLPAAINMNTNFKLEKNNTKSQINILAKNLGETQSFNLTDIQPLNGGWQNYIRGVVYEIQKLGGFIEGFDGEFEGNVPIGGGLSSSAALEISLACGLNKLFNLGFDNWQLIKLCQAAEHHFAGIKCGIMDQFASMMGKKNHAMLLDCRNLDFQYLPLDLKKYQFLLLNTNVSHTLASSEYNNRREECLDGLKIFQSNFENISSLRDVTIDQFAKTEEQFPEKIAKRCRHVITENNRVKEAVQSLIKSDFERLGSLIYNSHFSLQKDYEVSCPQLDYLVQDTLNKGYILGSRMMGGGFGGCTLNLIESKWIDSHIETASKNYRRRFGIDLTPYLVTISDGAAIA